MLVWIVKRVFAWLAALDDAAADRWAGRLGRWYLAMSARARRVTRRNLEAVYSELDAGRREALGEASARHAMWGLIETARSWNWPVGRLLERVEEVNGETWAEPPAGRGPGVLVIAPHFGAWELMSLYLQQDHDVAVLFKPPRHARMSDEITRHRQKLGGRLVPPTASGIRELHRTLKSGGWVGVLPDQRPKAGQGRVVPFFGIPATTGVLVPRLLRRTGAHAVYAVLRRDRPGYYALHFLPVDEALYGDDLKQALTAMNAGIERCVALAPEQYLWSYKRFKTEAGAHSAFYGE